MITSNVELAGLEGGRVELAREQLEDLAARIEGRLLAPGEDGWDDAVLLWNALVARDPGLVLQPRSAGDVAVAVRFARDNGLLLGIKSGGHNIAGIAIAEGGLTLDLSRMTAVDVDPVARLAHVEPGCRLQDVDRATQEHGLATPLGFISEVGVGGLTLGGGLGYLTRRFGWTVDNLEEVEIVTADGHVRVASRKENAELFWALRGGGGNFGVVTRFTYRLHEVGPMVHGGLILWPFERFDEIAAAYREITAEAPRELALWLILLRAPPLPIVPTDWHGERVCGMAVCYSGDLDRTDEVFAPMRALPNPLVDVLHDLPYVDVQSYLDDTEPKGNHYYWKTEYVSELGAELLGTLRDLFAECPIPDGDMGFLHLAGALNERADDDGSVGNRDVRYVVGIKGMWGAGEPEEEEYLRWVRAAGERVRPLSAARTYVNFQTEDEDEGRVRATYGSNFERLAAAKQAYDPQNLFRVNRNVPPATSARMR